MPQAIIFDFDDTLVQTREFAWTAIKETASNYYQLHLSDTDILEYWGRPYRELMEGLMGKEDTFENIDAHYSEVRTHHTMKEHLGSREVVQDIVDIMPTGILTASSKHLVVPDLERLQFPVERFFAIQTSEETTHHKPDPRVFDPILAKISQVPRQEVLYVGDAPRDYLAARDANLQFLGIVHGQDNPFLEYLEVAFVQSFQELKAAVL